MLRYRNRLVILGMMENQPGFNLRKRASTSCSNDSTASLLGEIKRSPKRSLRYSKDKISVAEKIIRTKNNVMAGSTQNSNSDRRLWHHTGLGTKYVNNEYEIKPHETSLTVMNYNVLADYLVHRHPELYNQVGIKWEHLDWNTRFDRLILEIKQYNCDIVCLQEVQEEHYITHFDPTLQALGYRSVFKKRTGDKMDGCAIFYKKDNLKLISSSDVEFMQPKALSCLDRDNIGLIGKFVTRHGPKNTPFCVATTHLLFNPRRDDVKLAQMAILLAELDRIAWSGDIRNPYCPVIITGDFNSPPNSPVVHLLAQGLFNYQNINYKSDTAALIPPELGITNTCQHFDTFKLRSEKSTSESDSKPHRLYHSSDMNCDNSEKPMQEEMSLYQGAGFFSHRFGFRSVYDPNRHYVTTRQRNYVMVDYIFYSTYYSQYLSKYIEGNLKLLGRVTLHTAKECEDMGHLPNSTCPSDHLCLVSKFLLTQKKQ